MKIYYKKLGEGPALIIIHGLYGSGDNWLQVAQYLKDNYTVYLPDMRNHGNSNHSDEFGYDVMAGDIYELIEERRLNQITLLGHSMGGRIAMRFAELHSEMIKQLIIVDMPPVTIQTKKRARLLFQSHEDIVNSLINIPVDTISSYAEADAILAKTIPLQEIREFLLKNLKTDEKQLFYWQINLPSIARNLEEIIVGEKTMNTQINCSSLFIKAERSGYLSMTDLDLIEMLFPNMQFETVKGAGHWVHVDQPEIFKSLLTKFLNL
jgi:esterase